MLLKRAREQKHHDVTYRNIIPRFKSKSGGPKVGPTCGLGMFHEDGNLDIEVVFTDGAASNNGMANATAGIGAYFPDNLQDNISRPVSFSPPTNNVAELEAIYATLQKAEPRMMKNKHICVKTDSQYCLNIFTRGIRKYRGNNFKNAKGQRIKNIELIKLIDEIVKVYHDKINFYKVAAHTDAPDEKVDPQGFIDWYGNDKADQLAANGRLQQVAINDRTSEHILVDLLSEDEE